MVMARDFARFPITIYREQLFYFFQFQTNKNRLVLCRTLDKAGASARLSLDLDLPWQIKNIFDYSIK